MDKVRIEKVKNGYIVTQAVDRDMCYVISECYVFNTIYEVYRHLEKVMGLNSNE